MMRFILEKDQPQRIDRLFAAIKSFKLDKPVEVIVQPYVKKRSDAQNSLMWVWHTEVAAEFSARTGHKWTKDEVHEHFFLPRFLGKFACDIEGQIIYLPQRSSKLNKLAMAEALTRYEIWCCEAGIELTQPESNEE